MLSADTGGPRNAPLARGITSRLFRLALVAFALLFVVLIVALLNNNFSITSPSRAEVRAQIDAAIDISTTWLSTHKQVFDNPALMFMVIDMERMSKDPRLTAFVNAYQQSEFVDATVSPGRAVWARMADSTLVVPVIDATRADTNEIHELLWDAYAIAPDKVRISAPQRENMFSRHRYWWGRRNHQLHALNMYRHFNGGTPSLDSTVNHLAEMVVRDQYFDVRVNDSYPQRIAFALGASRPDLIRSRWLDRMLSYQNSDGSWNMCWYHWCKGVFEFHWRDVYQAHATPQAMWALYMLKYRFPNWVDEHYE